MDLMFLILLTLILVLTYWHLKRIYSHWDNQNVPSIPNPSTIFGHMLPTIAVREGVAEFADKIYKSYDSSIVGFYFMRRPGIIVRDPDIVKDILQTNFSSFHNNVITLSEHGDPILSKNPFFTSDLHLWKERRNRISNNLVGRKLKCLFVVIQEVCHKMNAFVDRKIEENGEFYECELKKHFSRYTGEIVANAAFGIEGQSFEDNPDRLSFTEVAKNLLEPTLINGIKQSLIFFLPGIARFFNMGFLEKRTEEYMRQNVKSIMDKRKQTGEMPNDYLQFCLDTNPGMDDILADLVNFYGDVYETSGTTMTHVFYHLSQNPEVQLKLRDHINSVLKNTNGQVTYESLKNMTYLEQVIHESLRLFPAVGVQMKYCTEEITLKASDGINCRLEPGNPVFIPILGIHHDDKYWPNPQVFDPDRFSPENQIKNKKYTYLSFGEGPRMCVGMRLAFMLMKQAIVSLITKFSIEHSAKTETPLTMIPGSILVSFKGGLWGQFKKLN